MSCRSSSPPQIKAFEFAARTRVLLLRHVASGIDIDVSLGALPFERETIEAILPHRRRTVFRTISSACFAPNH
jgi:hypothetical protein